MARDGLTVNDRRPVLLSCDAVLMSAVSRVPTGNPRHLLTSADEGVQIVAENLDGHIGAHTPVTISPTRSEMGCAITGLTAEKAVTISRTLSAICCWVSSFRSYGANSIMRSVWL
jgi:hypothetical protein